MLQGGDWNKKAEIQAVTHNMTRLRVMYFKTNNKQHAQETRVGASKPPKVPKDIRVLAGAGI